MILSKVISTLKTILKKESFMFIHLLVTGILSVYHSTIMIRLKTAFNKLCLESNWLGILRINVKKHEINLIEKKILFKENESIIKQKIEDKSLTKSDFIVYLKSKPLYNGEDIMTSLPIIENNINLYFIVGIMSLLIGICLSLYVYIYIYKKDTNIYKILLKHINILHISILLFCIYWLNTLIFSKLNLSLTQENLWQYVSFLYFTVVVNVIFLIIISNKYLTKMLKEIRKITIVYNNFLISILFAFGGFELITNFGILLFLLYIFNVLTLYILYTYIYNKNLFEYCLLIFFIILIIHFLIYMLVYCNVFNHMHLVEEYRLYMRQLNLINLKIEVLDDKIIKLSEHLNKLNVDTQNL